MAQGGNLKDYEDLPRMVFHGQYSNYDLYLLLVGWEVGDQGV